MSQIKLTKNELRAQQLRLGQLMKYLPTLQLKKAMLQAEVFNARAEFAERQQEYLAMKEAVQKMGGLFKELLVIDLKTAQRVRALHKRYENIAGVEIPYFEGIEFEEISYSLFDTPPWVEGAIYYLQKEQETLARLEIADEKQKALERELREVSIRVNLFEKVLIPRALGNIKKIKIFLGDQLLAAVGQAKVAKAKIEERKVEESAAHQRKSA
jgi:V/A-type H+-transporting ATPase subunit D